MKIGLKICAILELDPYEAVFRNTAGIADRPSGMLLSSDNNF